MSGSLQEWSKGGMGGAKKGRREKRKREGGGRKEDGIQIRQLDLPVSCKMF